MTDIDLRAARYDGAVLLMPRALREQLRAADKILRAQTEEIRLRCGCPLTLVVPSGETMLSDTPVTPQDIDGLVSIATGASAYSSRDSMRSGYITVRGGYRIGLCGTAIVQNGCVTGLKSIASVAVRISRAIPELGPAAAKMLWRDGLCSTLIMSPPGGGKTTLLRELIRVASDGDASMGLKMNRVAVADERSEIAAVFDGKASHYVGMHTDVLDSCPRADGVMMLLRSMNPQVIAFDEITAEQDMLAAEAVAGCGVHTLATAHALNAEDAAKKPMYRRLLEKGVFEKVLFIENRGGKREFRALAAREVLNAV